MSLRKLTDNVFEVGAIDWDRRLFDELIPLPDGTSYNSYLIKGSEKIALIDTVDPPKENVLLENLKESGIKNIDYVISHHAEQDHSGTIPKILEIYPNAKVVTNAKCKDMLKDLLMIPEEKFMIVKEGDKLSLGNLNLKFILTPWVHWPETMSTYLEEEKILFSCDFFGSHYAANDLFVDNEPLVYEAAKRYFAEIMMPFRTIIKNNLEKIKKLEINMIAPSHGQVYPKPQFILDAYQDWISDEVKNEVVIPYVSMHESTAKMAKYLIDKLTKKGITVHPFNLTKSDVGELAKSLVTAATVIIGSPTVLAGGHPQAVYAAFLTNALRPKTKFISIFGSYGWGGKMVEQLSSLISNLKVEVIDPVLIKGYPKKEDWPKLDQLVDTIYLKHKEAGIL